MTSYEEFLEKIRTGDHPEFAELIWDGESRQTLVSVKFDLGRLETDTTVRERAWRYLKQLTSAEQAIVSIRVVIQNGRPVRALIEPRGSGVRIDTGRLRGLEENLK